MSITVPSAGSAVLASWGVAVTDRLNVEQGCVILNTTGTQSFTTAVGAVVTLAAADVVHDPGAAFVDGSDHIVIPETGLYLVTAYIHWANNASGYRRFHLQVDAADLYVVNVTSPGSASLGQNISMVHRFTANQTVRLYAVQTSGGSLNIDAKELSIVRIG